MGHYHLFSRMVHPTGNVVVERVIRTLKEEVAVLPGRDLILSNRPGIAEFSTVIG